MGRHSRNKGKCSERELVNLAKSYGLDARRTWQNASSDNPLVRNVDVEIAGYKCQSKRIAKLPKFLKELLPEGCQLGFVREDNGEWLVLLPAEMLFRFLPGAKK